MPLEDNIAGLTAAINRLADVFGQSAGVLDRVPSPATDAPKVKQSAKDAPKTPKAEPTPVPTSDPKAPAVDFEAVKAAIRELGVVRGRETAADLMAEYKVAKVSELKSSQYAAFVARAKALGTEVVEETTEDEDDFAN